MIINNRTLNNVVNFISLLCMAAIVVYSIDLPMKSLWVVSLYMVIMFFINKYFMSVSDITRASRTLFVFFEILFTGYWVYVQSIGTMKYSYAAFIMMTTLIEFAILANNYELAVKYKLSGQPVYNLVTSCSSIYALKRVLIILITILMMVRGIRGVMIFAVCLFVTLTSRAYLLLEWRLINVCEQNCDGASDDNGSDDR